METTTAISLKEVFSIAIRNKEYTLFKSVIDSIFNGTPLTEIDDSEYVLVKVNPKFKEKLKEVAKQKEEFIKQEQEKIKSNKNGNKLLRQKDSNRKR